VSENRPREVHSRGAVHSPTEPVRKGSPRTDDEYLDISFDLSPSGPSADSMPGYGWAFGEHQMAMGIGYKGPAVLGVNWTTGMFDTDVDGYIKPTGAIEGGHAIVCPKVSVSGDYYELHNSWGKGWGVNGRARMKRGAMAELLTADGECCFPTIRRLTPSPLAYRVAVAAAIRDAVPGIAISTDVIVGFCGETEAQFQATLRLLETVGAHTP